MMQHRPSLAQRMISREERKSKRMTASLGSFFVFDTCKESDLKSAMDEMDETSRNASGGAQGAFGNETLFPLDDATSFGFDTFVVPSQSSPSTIPSSQINTQSTSTGGIGDLNFIHNPSLSSSSSAIRRPQPPNSIKHPFVRKTSNPTAPGPPSPTSANHTFSDSSPQSLSDDPSFLDLMQGDVVDISTLSSLGPGALQSQSPSPLNVSASPLTVAPPAVPNFNLSTRSPTSSPTRVPGAFQPPQGGFFAQNSPPASSTPSSFSSNASMDEFEYYAAEQLDAMIDLLDTNVGFESLVFEDDQGLTDWLQDDNFTQFEFNPEWLELTLTMKPEEEIDSPEGSEQKNESNISSQNALGERNPSPISASRRATVADGSIPSGSVSDRPKTLQTKNSFSSAFGRPSVNQNSFANDSNGTQNTESQSFNGQLERPRPPSVPENVAKKSMASTAPSLESIGGTSPFLLPTAIAEEANSGKKSNALGGGMKKGEKKKKKKSRSARTFVAPLISSPGIGESAVTISSAVYRVVRLMDPERPFESLMHDDEAILSSSPLVTLSPTLAVPPSAGSNQQSPPSFTVHISVFGPFWDVLNYLCGISSSTSTQELFSSFPTSSSSSLNNSSSHTLTGAPLVASRSKFGNANSSTTSGAQQTTQNTTNSNPLGSSSSSKSLNQKNCLTFQEWKGYPLKKDSNMNFIGVPHVLVSTIAIVNDQGRTKRLVKLVALGMTPTDTTAIPNIPNTQDLRRNDPLVTADPYTTSLIASLSSAHGSIFLMPSQLGSVRSESDIAETLTNISSSELDDFQATFKLYQRMNYHAGPIRANPHVRVLAISGWQARVRREISLIQKKSEEEEKENPSFSALDDPSSVSKGDPSHHQLAFILNRALQWAKLQGIGVMKTKSDSKWLKLLSALPVHPSFQKPSWYPHPLLSHLAAQTHALRMEALMTSFDHIQKVASSVSSSTSNASKPNQSVGSKNDSRSKLGSGPIASNSDSRATVAFTGSSSSQIGSQSSSNTSSNKNLSNSSSNVGYSSGSDKRTSAFAHTTSKQSPSSPIPKQSVNKRIISVIGLTGSGKTSLIRRACHARYSRSNKDSGIGSNGSFDASSTFMMSTLSPMTSTMMGNTYGNSNVSSSSQTTSSSFADIFFNMERCVLEFIETPTRSRDKIQFYKDINRSHGFIFVYAGVHPSPSEISEMNQSINDIWQAKRQIVASSSNAQRGLSNSGQISSSSSSALSRLQVLNPSSSSSSSSSTSSTNYTHSLFASSSMKRPSSVNDIPIIIVGTQAPPPIRNLVESNNEESNNTTNDPSMMTLTQLLAKHNGIAHFVVDTAPVKDAPLGRALQWLYNRIGEETLSLKGVRATNRPHHSGSISVAGARRASTIGVGSSSTHSNSFGHPHSSHNGGTSSSDLSSPVGSRKVFLPQTPPASRISTFVGTTSGVSVPNNAVGKDGKPLTSSIKLTTSQGGQDDKNQISSSNFSAATSSASNNTSSYTSNNNPSRNTTSGNPGGSIALFMRVEALVVKMRGGVQSQTNNNASSNNSSSSSSTQTSSGMQQNSNFASSNLQGQSSTLTTSSARQGNSNTFSPLFICDRRLENGAWIPMTGSGTSENSGASSFEDMTSSNQSKKKQKILNKCFTGSEAVEWVVNAIVRPERTANSAGPGASGSYLLAPSQLRTEALSQLQPLLDLSVIRCVWGPNLDAMSSAPKFLDAPDAIYRFQMDEDNESVLNTRKVWIGEVDHAEIEQLAAWLYQKVQPFIVAIGSINTYGDEFSDSSSSRLSIDGAQGASSQKGMISVGSSGSLAISQTSNMASKDEDEDGEINPSNSSATSSSYASRGETLRSFVIDGSGFKRSPHFGDLLLFTAKLQRVKVDKMTRVQQVAFWINVYNILAIHIAIQHGYVGKSKSKRKLLHLKTFYQIEGALYSLDDIMHGILRGNRKNPFTSKVSFKPNDPRRKRVLFDDSASLLSKSVYTDASKAGNSNFGQKFPLDPRIHFALTSLSKSSPYITPMRADTLDNQLNALATAFLASQLDVDFKRSSLSLPSSLLSFRYDFAKAPAPFLSFLASFSEPEKAKNITFLANKLKEKDIKSKSEDSSPCAPRFLRG